MNDAEATYAIFRIIEAAKGFDYSIHITEGSKTIKVGRYTPYLYDDYFTKDECEEVIFESSSILSVYAFLLGARYGENYMHKAMTTKVG